MPSVVLAPPPARRHGPSGHPLVDPPPIPASARPRVRDGGQARRARRAPGQALVELALVLFVCMVLLVGMIDLSRAFSMAVAVQGGAGAAARLGAQRFLGTGITDQTIMQRLIDSSKPFLDGCTAASTSPTTCSSSGGSWTLTVVYTPSAAAGNTVEVRAVGLVPPLAALSNLASWVGLGQITVRGGAQSILL